MDRRDFLRGAALASVPLAFSPLALAGAAAGGEERPPAGLIVREKKPENLEFPFSTLDRFLTPNNLFYVRNHFPAPELDASTWRLKVEGAVERPLALSYEDLKKLPTRAVTATLECAGNSRALLVPKAGGVPWELGAVGNAEWAGVPLGAVLERAGLKDAAVEVVLEGADKGEVSGPPKSPGVIPFARSLPLAKARRPEVLLAHKMNGADLPASHGFPLRAVVSGWYGMASVKWLTRLLVTERPFAGYFQTMNYTYWERVRGLATLAPITGMQVKSLVARPTAGETIPAGKSYRVHGAAWAGESEVAKVDVSTDGGKTWEKANLAGKSVPFAWRLWEHEWRPAEAGKYTVLSRATDSRGRVQPLQRDRDRLNYMVAHVLPVEVTVR
ncbi:MAG: sulfite oxidase [Planctomycetes bacterium]|nr:sulfite oxidase [Planctomycetota bacterium]